MPARTKAVGSATYSSEESASNSSFRQQGAIGVEDHGLLTVHLRTAREPSRAPSFVAFLPRRAASPPVGQGCEWPPEVEGPAIAGLSLQALADPKTVHPPQLVHHPRRARYQDEAEEEDLDYL